MTAHSHGFDPRGSRWRRWDPNAHAPYTFLDDNFRGLQASRSLWHAGRQSSGTRRASGTIAATFELLVRGRGEMQAFEFTDAPESARELLRSDDAYANLPTALARLARFGKLRGRTGCWTVGNGLVTVPPESRSSRDGNVGLARPG